MQTAILAAAGHLVYAQIPAVELREFVEGLSPWLAKCERADIPPFGLGHRFREGHDLLIDVPKTFFEDGFVDGVQHAGHIVLTDFPTLAVAEGYSDLLAALAGKMDMSMATFFDTFGEGMGEILLGVTVQNPILTSGGLLNLLAGLVSTWKTYTVYVDPLAFFGSAMGGAFLGALLTLALAREETADIPVRGALCNAVRSASAAALFTVHSFFGFGALLGMAAYSFGRELAKRAEQEGQMYFQISQRSVDSFLKTLGEGDKRFWSFWEAARPRLVLLDSPALLASEVRFRLPWNARFLRDELPFLDGSPRRVPDTPRSEWDSTPPKL